MLTNLIIRDVVLIDHLNLEFKSGLSVLTGETGAGKSILLDSLGLSTGSRADARLVRHGCQQATVSAVFDLPPTHPVHAALAAQDFNIDGEALILRRTLGIDGRSRAFINDQPVSIGFLKSIGEALVEVHGQFDNQRLLKPDAHRGLLDAFAGHHEMVSQTQMTFHDWRAAVEARKQAEAEAEDARRDEDYIRHAVEELNAMDPQPGEEATLAAQRTMMMHGEQLVEALAEAVEQATGHNGAETKLQNAVRALERMAEKAEGRLDKAISALDQARDGLADGIAEVNRLTNDLDLNPARLEEIEERLFALRALARKHSVQVDALAELRETMNRRLASIEDGSSALAALTQAEKAARATFANAATELSNSRRRAATELDKKVAVELVGLHLDKAKFVTDISELAETEWRVSGIDQVSFLVSTNPGVPPGPLNKIASGGEMARFMLALKVVLAEADPIMTLIFDEVDAGVGGAVAESVGERLGQLGSCGQVLVVTHSPQVAARGGNHWKVSKSTAADEEIESRVTTSVSALDLAERKEEIARMLAGRQVTDEARAAAESLLAGGCA
jgi:DNA repair protein RecN (Recombination protein N)